MKCKLRLALLGYLLVGAVAGVEAWPSCNISKNKTRKFIAVFSDLHLFVRLLNLIRSTDSKSIVT